MPEWHGDMGLALLSVIAENFVDYDAWPSREER
jgi:hypothetical protein